MRLVCLRRRMLLTIAQVVVQPIRDLLDHCCWMQVEGILHIRLICGISVSVLDVLLLDQAGHYTLRPYGHVLWLHGHCVIQLLLHDRHHWLLCLLAVCAADICCSED